jgi:hypothetical protein
LGFLWRSWKGIWDKKMKKNQTIIFIISMLIANILFCQEAKIHLKTIKIKDEAFFNKNIEELKPDELSYFQSFDDLLFVSGIKMTKSGKETHMEGYFQIFSQPELKQKYAELLTIQAKGGNETRVFSLSDVMYHDNKFYTDINIKYPSMIVYYDLKNYELVKVKNNSDGLNLIKSLSKNKILVQELTKSFRIVNDDFETIRKESAEQMAEESGVEKYKNIHFLLNVEDLLFYSADDDLGILNLETMKSKFIKLNETYLVNDTVLKKNMITDVNRIGDSIYALFIGRENNFPNKLYKYNKENNTITEASKEALLLYNYYNLNVQIKDLSFFHNVLVPNSIAIVKGDFEKILLLRVKKFNNLGYISGIVQNGDKYLMGTSIGVFEFKIDDIYDMIDKYGAKELKNIYEVP